MKKDQPFEFAENRKLTSKPICWTNKPLLLSKKLGEKVITIEETQKKLLFQSLLNSAPFKSFFLQEYEQDLTKTVLYLIDLEKIPVMKDEMKDGFNYIETQIEAGLIKDKVDMEAT
jgi:hypothetical protein